MKLARFYHQGKIGIGAVTEESIIPAWSVKELPQEMSAFLAAGKDAWALLASKAGNQEIPLNEVSLLAPVASPQKFLGVGLNYADHIEETGLDTPEFPTFFNKQSSCVIGPNEAIHRPTVSEKLDYEGELAIVIGKACRHVPYEKASEVIAGFTIVNDVSVRDWQIKSPTWTLGKSFDTHGPMGPWIVTADEVNPHNLELKTWVNDELRQHSNTKHLIFDCYQLIETLSTVCTLQPGDVIATGTSSGVGVKMKPRGYMKPGDRVTIEIEGIGKLSNPVIDEPDTQKY
ncbi:fumarylacetoacetate hydrolase family protein [Neptuniibacter caesariensis]|uniref:5-carboxymethyl-2-hydroxymuconate delta-isomerase n=1 Tax=Neptuniibacter caesariensis TaxID=207954 RepID=A0A7U8GTB6_NEPCE|nr:fumarylacetoacetate hydrolase family protein [Neptuniibacter caesariensis]EAR62261.1 5-carboxymethyl-2-hydroxymuconate delta-isomerase [Oceanospirillum sp. MED92] [Neptuniibacter caesariensis]